MTIYHNVYMKCEPYMTFQEIIHLHHVIRNELPNDARILEVGAWKGGSTLNMGTACLGTDRRITVIDIWDGREGNFYKVWLENVTLSGIFDLLEPIQEDSLVAMRRLLETRPLYYDFCLLDSDHELQRTKEEFELALELVKLNGLIYFHDIGDVPPYLYPGCTQVWYEMAQPMLLDQRKVNCLFGGRKP